MLKYSLALACAVIGCNNSEVTHGLVVGALIDQTGPNADSSFVQAVNLAASQMNEALTHEGYPIQFSMIASDTQTDPQRAANEALSLVLTHDARALILDNTSDTESVAGLMYGATPSFNVLVQCSSCSSSDLLDATHTNSDPVLQSIRRNTLGNLSRTTSTTQEMAYVMLRSLTSVRNGVPTMDRNADNAIKIGIYGSNDPDGISASQALIDAAVAMFAASYGGAASTQQNPTRLSFTRIMRDPSLPPLPDQQDPQAAFTDYAADIAALTSTFVTDTVTGTRFGDARAPDYIFVMTYALNAANFSEADFAPTGNRIPVIYYQHYHQSNTLFQLGSVVAAGTAGISQVVTSQSASGQNFTHDFQAAAGFMPFYGDAMYYDNAVTIMLAALIGSVGLADPQSVPADAIIANIGNTSVSSGFKIAAGIDGFRLAVQVIRTGQPINYDGASGPVDFDASHNVRDDVQTYLVDADGTFADVGDVSDCVDSPASCRPGD